ncbi:MAG: hypothetical protein ABII12_13205 [Planctomycetota bacterium]
MDETNADLDGDARCLRTECCDVLRFLDRALARFPAVKPCPPSLARCREPP